MPLAEMSETEDAIYLEIEIPGMDAKDLDIRVTKDAIMISGERLTKSKFQQNGTTQSEFRYGKFSRVISLPAPIDNTKVKGDYQNGIVKLELLKIREENKAIKVNLESNNTRAIAESQPQAELNLSNGNSATANQPEGGYGNTSDLWNENQNAASEVETTVD